MEKDSDILRRGIEYALENNNFNKLNLIEQAENVCVFGLGKYFDEAFVSKGVKKRYKVNLLSDNNPEKWGKTIQGLLCIKPTDLVVYDKLIVIIMLGNPLPVQEQLDELGIPWVTHVDLSLEDMMDLPKERVWFENKIPQIEQALSLFCDEESRKVYVKGICNRIAYPISKCKWKDLYSAGEYFNQSFMQLGENEEYVDCGAYNGDTILEFIKTAKNYKNIYAFELDKDNYEEMQRRTQGVENLHLFNYGVWNNNQDIIYGCGNGSNEPRDGISILKAGDGEEMKASVVKLDDLLRDKSISFIKMDIEGSEVQALEGAEEIIKAQAPKLAICVYHKTTDLWEIPLLLKKFNPQYTLKLRHHHCCNCCETVLYAYV